MQFSSLSQTHTASQYSFSSNDDSALETVVQLLDHQEKARNVPAVEFRRLLRTLEDNLQALHATLRDAADLVNVDISSLPSETFLV